MATSAAWRRGRVEMMRRHACGHKARKRPPPPVCPSASLDIHMSAILWQGRPGVTQASPWNHGGKQRAECGSRRQQERWGCPTYIAIMGCHVMRHDRSAKSTHARLEASARTSRPPPENKCGDHCDGWTPEDNRATLLDPKEPRRHPTPGATCRRRSQGCGGRRTLGDLMAEAQTCKTRLRPAAWPQNVLTTDLP